VDGSIDDIREYPYTTTPTTILVQEPNAAIKFNYDTRGRFTHTEVTGTPLTPNVNTSVSGYDNLGNPITYKGNNLTWARVGDLTSITKNNHNSPNSPNSSFTISKTAAPVAVFALQSLHNKRGRKAPTLPCGILQLRFLCHI